MANRQRQTNKFLFRGINTRLVADAIPIGSGKYPVATNVRAQGDSKIRTRPGYNLAFQTGGFPATDMRALTTVGTTANVIGQDNKPRIIVHDSSGGVWLDDGLKKGTVGTGGIGASLIPFRPNQSPQSWMYICNGTGYRKFQAPDSGNNVANQKVGIAEPQTPTDACPDGLAFNDFTALAASWAASGTAGAPSDATRSTDTVIAIFQDPASVAPAALTRYTVQSNATTQYSTGETLTFNKSGGGTIVSVVEDVFPPINGGTALTIQAIIYTTGLTGPCIIVPSQVQVGANNQQQDENGNPIPNLPFLPGQVAGLRRGSLIQIGSEVAFVRGVTTGPQSQLAIEVSTTGAHVAGEQIVGILGFAVSGLSALVVGQTFTSAQINSAITTGIGKISQTLGTNPFNLSLGTIGTPQENDHIHLSAATDVPINIVEVKILLDVGDGTFTQNILSYSINPSAFQPVFSNTATQLTGVQTQAQNTLISNQADSRNQADVTALVADVITTQPSAPATAATGGIQFTEIIVPISAFTRGGNDQTNTVAQCAAVQIVINASGSLNFYFGSIWVGGGGQPDVGDTISPNPTTPAASAPYTYQVRPRSSLTGARGNPSPTMRYGVVPHRQKVIVSLPSATYDAQIDTWDVFRYGGTVTSWRYIGSAPATAATFVDNYFDDVANAGSPLDFDNFEPWPTVDLPFSATVGVAGVTSITVYGTLIQVLYSALSASPPTINRWLPGTLITLNGNTTYTLWNRARAIAGGFVFRLVENAGAPTVTTIQVNEPLLAAQNLPYLWGPDSNGIIFGCGDPLRPGFLYSSKANNPDSTPNNVYDLVQPGEPLMGGEVVDGLALVASSKRWWQLQYVPSSPRLWNPVETPAGRGLAAPFGHCTDGKFVYFWAKDGIYSMIPGLPAISLTDADIGNIFPQVDDLGNATLAKDVTYGLFTFYAPDYSRVSQFRLTVSNSILRAHYRDSNGFARTIVCDMSLDSSGNPRMAWSQDFYAANIINSYAVEQPTGTLLTVGAPYAQVYLCDPTGIVYTEADLVNDNGTPITCAVATPEWDGGDDRIQRQWLDAWIDAAPASGITVVPIANGSLIGTITSISGATRTYPPPITPIGNPIANTLGVSLNWTDNFNIQTIPTQLLGWSLECIALPMLIRTWQSVPTSHGLQGYQFVYRIRFAYLTKGSNTVSLTLTAFDGTSPSVITLPATNGTYQKAEFVPTFNKGLLYTYQATSTDQWAPIVEDCDILVGAWNRTGPCAVFQGLGGIEAQ